MSSSPFPTDSRLQKPVCVFCGSSPGSSSIYSTAAEAVGQALAKERIPLVYGGGRRGIMGVVSHSALQAGGYVHGIVPRALTGRASEHTPAPRSQSVTPASNSETQTDGSDAKGGRTLSNNTVVASQEGQGKDLLDDDFGGKLSVEIVGSMHERKMKMAQLSTGGFIVLPGGYGTFEEALEMVTWNQLGIHRLPLIILNIGNFYSHLQKQFEVAVEAGFIAPQNLNLLKIVDLPGGEAGNADESKVKQWGEAAVNALREFSFGTGTGYGLDWKKADKLEKDKTGSNAIASSSTSKPTPSALFTTLRYTSPSSSPTLPITDGSVPLLHLHIERLREAHAHFSARDGKDRWGQWLGDDFIRSTLLTALEEKERQERGDWRVRVVLHPYSKLEIQIVPAPAGAGPFIFKPSASRSTITRPLVLDPQVTEATSESPEEGDLRLYKTIDRGVYDRAYERGASISSNHPEVLLHTSTDLLETTTSNIALLVEGQWLTPTLTDDRPFLNGVMRRYLLSSGTIREAELTVEDYERAKLEGWRIIGFNGLRGVWEAEIV